jgi:hypothetical protein
MAEQFKSVFGDYTENISVVAKALEAAKVQPIYTQYLDWATPTVGLDFSTVVGKERQASMASVVDIDALHPHRSRSAAVRVDGEVPSIKVKRSLTQKQYRDYLMLQNIKTMKDADKLKAIVKFILDDMKYVTDSVKARINYMYLQAVSRGYIEITEDNNPDGIVTDVIPMGLLETNFKESSDDVLGGGSKLITEIMDMVQLAKYQGDEISEIQLSSVLWNKIKLNKELMSEMKAYFNPGSNARAVFTLENFNNYLTDNNAPNFKIIDSISRVEIDGKQTIVRPFSDTNLVFVPSGKLGIIHNAYSIEELEPVPNVEYTTVDRILLSKWFQRNPWGEMTAAETIAIPGIEQIESIYHLKADLLTED